MKAACIIAVLVVALPQTSVCQYPSEKDRVLAAQVDAVVRNLKSDDAEVRASALRTLVGLKSAEMPRQLKALVLSMLSDQDPDVRRCTSEVLANVTDDETTDGLIKALKKEQDIDVRKRLIFAIGQHKGAATKAIPALIAVMREPRVAESRGDTWGRSCYISPLSSTHALCFAAQALVKIGSEASIPLADIVIDPRCDLEVRFAAMRSITALGNTAESVVDLILGSVLEPDESFRVEAVIMLTEVAPRSDRVKRVLFGCLSDSSIKVRVQVAIALKSIAPGNVVSIPTLIDGVRSSVDEAISRAIIEIGAAGPAARAAIPDLIQKTKVNGVRVREIATRALGKVGADDKDATNRLRELLKDPERTVREEARVALRMPKERD